MADAVQNEGELPPPTSLPAKKAEKGADFPKESYSSDTKVASIAALKAEAPEVYEKMLLGIAQTIVSRIKKQQERLKRAMREGYSR